MKFFSVCGIALIILSGCKSTPRLYSAVIPMEDGSHFTSTTASTKDKALLRATRNAERYCGHKEKEYAVITMKTMYEGILESEAADNRVKKSTAIASKLTLGVISSGTGTDYRTELAFKCLD